MSRGRLGAGAVPRGVSSAEGEVTLEIWRLLVSAGVLRTKTRFIATLSDTLLGDQNIL